MKRMILFLAVLLMAAPVFGALTYDQAYYRNNRAYLGSATSNDPLYNLWGTLEGLYEGSSAFDAIRIIESTGATYYTKLQGGNQSANLTLTLPTAYAAVSGYVLSSTDAGVLSWAANGGTFTGGSITSDVTLSNGVDILSTTTTAHTNAVQAYDVDGLAYVDVLRWTNGDTAAMVLGASTVEFSLASTGLDISTAGAISNATTIQASGVVTASGGITLQNAATITNGTSSEIALTSTSEDLVFDMDSASNVVGLKSSTGVNGIALGTVDDLSGVGTITFDAAAATITTATTDTAQDLTLSVTGATNSSLVLVSSGTAADALTISTSAGGMDITVAGAAAAEDLDITANSSVNISSTEAAADDSIVISALGAASGIDITSLGDIDITTTGAATEDISITNTGGSINIRANENDAAAIVIDTAGGGGTSEEINILNDQGTGSSSIDIDSTAGSIDVDAGDDITINAVDDLTLNGGSAGSIINIGTNTHGNVIHIGDNDTTADSIAIGSAKDTPVTLSGLAVTVGSTGTTSATTIQSGTGDLALTSTDDITLTVNTAVTDNITITNTPGTAADAIAIQATAGGIDMDAAAALDVDISGGQVLISSKDNAASAIALTANVGTSETIAITNTLGTDEAAINIDATAGGIDIDFATGKNMAVTGGQFIVTSNEAVASAINLVTNTGAAETIVVTNTQGTGEGAITLTSTAGGIDLNAAVLKDVDINGGQVKLTGVDNVAGAIALLTNTGTSETITVTNTVGTGAGAITLTSTAGGMTINGGSGADISVTSTGKSVNLTATEAASDAIALTASTGAGGVTITGGTGGVSAKSAANVGAVVAGTCTAVEYEVNGHHRTVLSLLGGATFDLEDKDDGNGIKIYDFPEGNVIILGAFMDAVVTSAATVTTSYVMSVGTAIGADAEATLTSTEADFIASCTVTCGAGNEDAHGVSALTAAGLVMVPFDGTGGGKDVYLNAAVASGDISATSAIAAVSGTITIEWIYLGDF